MGQAASLPRADKLSAPRTVGQAASLPKADKLSAPRPNVARAPRPCAVARVSSPVAMGKVPCHKSKPSLHLSDVALAKSERLGITSVQLKNPKAAIKATSKVGQAASLPPEKRSPAPIGGCPRPFGRGSNRGREFQAPRSQAVESGAEGGRHQVIGRVAQHPMAKQVSPLSIHKPSIAPPTQSPNSRPS